MRISVKFLRRAFFLVTGLALALEVAHAIHPFGGPGMESLVRDRIYLGLEVAGSLACLVRVAVKREHRAAWACIAAGLVCWTGGDVAWLYLPDPIPYPSIADVFYLGFYPFCFAGMALLLARGRDRVAARFWVDGVIAGLAVAALTVALSFDTILNSTGSTTAQTAVNLAYPLLDLVLVGFVLTAFATQAWRPGRGWALLGVGVMLNAAADTIYLYQDALGIFHDGSLVDMMWPAALTCCGWAAWQPWQRQTAELNYGRQTFALPAGFALLALGLLAYSQFISITHAAGLLATAALAVATGRAGWTFRDNVRLLRRTSHEALTDGLTGLPNRRRLMHDLEEACEAGANGNPSTLAFFDLDGFKTYNDTFGHAAGDMLLGRLAKRLAGAIAGHGHAYRLGGDEFCVLLEGRRVWEGPLLSACERALDEQGEGFRVGASCGVVAIPDEADTATHALQLADQRMYAAKDDTRASSRRQTRDVLLQVLREREPDLHRHLHGVAALALAVAREMRLPAEQLDEVARAAELHDIGKLAIPDDVLHKPGPLDAAEWELMRQHTIIGDRILAAAPAMRPVARIVRSSHERFDGSGYPDGLAGEQIPLGARIVSICDAFNAMTSERSYQPTVDAGTAVAELRRCGGVQFDPAVVEVFATIIERGDVPAKAPARDAAPLANS